MQTLSRALVPALVACLPGLSFGQTWFEGFSVYPDKGSEAFFAVGDLDGDLDLDLVSRGGGQLRSWLQFGGSARFQEGPSTVLPSGLLTQELSVTPIDMNGDGFVDIPLARGQGGPNELVLLRGQGDGSFAVELLPLQGVFRGLATGDFTDDGLPDVAITVSGGSGDALQVFSYGTGGLSEFDVVATPQLGFQLAPIDWDGDGVEDLVTTAGEQLQIVFGGAGGLQVGPTIMPGLATLFSELYGADFDGDGLGDLAQVAAGFGGGSFVQLYQGQVGGPPIPFPVQAAGAAIPSFSRVGDWDGDGDSEFIGQSLTSLFAAPVARVTENSGAGLFSAGFSFEVDLAGPLPGVGDIDGDGLLDTVFGSKVLFGDGNFALPFGMGAAGAPTVLFRDREGDGDVDSFTEFSQSTFQVSLNDGTGQFPSDVPTPDPGAPLRYRGVIGAADFTGDGRTDYVMRLVNEPPFQLPEFLEWRLVVDDGLGGYVDVGAAAPPSVPGPDLGLPSLGQVGYLAVDIDSDGDLDLVRGERVWINSGTGTSPSFDPSVVLTTFGIAAAGDVDGDGDVDLVTAEDGSPDRLWLRRNQGALSFTTEALLSAGALTRNVALLDLDGDLDLDVIADLVDVAGRVAIAKNVGGMFPASVEVGSTGIPGADAFGADDVNQDGTLDLLLGTSSAGQFIGHGVLLGNATAIGFEPAGTFEAGAVSAFFDADGDGDLDAWNSEGPVRGRTFEGSSAGFYRQYGEGGAGSAGAVPVLGATGPWRVGSTTASLRVVLGNGGAPAFLAISGAEDLLVDFPFAGLTTLVSPGLINLLEFGLTPGVPGAGELLLPVGLSNPAFAGIQRYHQVFVVDPGAASLLAPTNGLEIRIG